jgi:hypothetical protein
VAVAAIVASACGSRTPPPYREGPIDFAYAQEGADRRLAELRGRPVVLVLVRISELPSELYLDQLVDAYGRAAGETRFLVLTVAPNEEPFLGEYVATRELPFPIGVAEWPVAAGESGLGLVPIVPTTYLVDPDGAIVELIAGGVKADDLVADLKRRGWK